MSVSLLRTPVAPDSIGCPVPSNALRHGMAGVARLCAQHLHSGARSDYVALAAERRLAHQLPSTTRATTLDDEPAIVVGGRYLLTFSDGKRCSEPLAHLSERGLAPHQPGPVPRCTAWDVHDRSERRSWTFPGRLRDLQRDGVITPIVPTDSELPLASVAALGMMHGVRPFYADDRHHQPWTHVVSITPKRPACWRATKLPKILDPQAGPIHHSEHAGPYGWWSAAVQALENGLDHRMATIVRIGSDRQ